MPDVIPVGGPVVPRPLILEGDIRECNGDDECEPSGTTVVEESSGKLYKVDFAKKRLELRKSTH
jgi:hypothetical protein